MCLVKSKLQRTRLIPLKIRRLWPCLIWKSSRNHLLFYRHRWRVQYSVDRGFPECGIGLKGLFATVYTDGVTPTSNVSILDGFNVLSAPGNPKARRIEAPISFYDHMRSWLPSFRF